MKNAMDIEQDIFDVCVPFFKGRISGKVYKSGMRPVDSSLEDVVVQVSDADALQMQSGTAYVIIYVPDLTIASYNVPDKGRIQEFCNMDEELLQALYENLYSEYDLALGRATRPHQEKDMRQYFVSIRIDFRINNN